MRNFFVVFVVIHFINKIKLTLSYLTLWIQMWKIWYS